MSGLLLAAFMAIGGATQANATPPDLSGRWVLNRELSEDAREKMRDGRDGMARPGGGGGAGGSGMGRPGGGGGKSGGRSGRRPPPGGDEGGRRGGDDRRAAMRAVFEAASELTITQTAREIAILETDGRLRALHPDGEKYEDSSGAKVKARWDGERLLVTTSQERGPTVTETWRRAGEPAQIVVELRFQPPSGQEVTVKRVYDRADAEP